MQNPLGSEPEAFRFLLVTVGAFTAIAVASILGGVWVGLPVWAVLTAAAAAFYLAPRRRKRGLKTAPPHRGDPSEQRILVLAYGVTADETLVHEIERVSSGPRRQVLVLCPAQVSALDQWTSAVDGARALAQRHLDESLTQLHARGIEASGEIGDDDPLQAIEDLLRTFPADEIIIGTRPRTPDDAAVLDVVAGAHERFALPITHVVVRGDHGAVTGQ